VIRPVECQRCSSDQTSPLQTVEQPWRSDEHHRNTNSTIWSKVTLNNASDYWTNGLSNYRANGPGLWVWYSPI